MSHWANDYIGLPWESGAQGPEAYDCYALVRHIQARFYGREMPMVQVDAHDPELVRSTFANHSERARWLVVDEPKDGDCVLVYRGGEIDHIGIYLELDGGRVLHAMTHSGVVCTTLPVLKRLGWNPIEFYRFKESAC